MKIEISYDKSSSLLSAIIFLIVGIILFTNASTVLSFISIVIGSLLLIWGIIKTFIYYQKKKNNELQSKWALTTSVILIIFGIVFIFFSDIIETSIRLVFGAWILLSGINQFINAISLSSKNTRFKSSLIISLLLIVLSLFVIFNDNLLLESIGIVMIVYSAIEIIGFIFSKKKTKIVEPKEGETTLIIPDKEKKLKK